MNGMLPEYVMGLPLYNERLTRVSIESTIITDDISTLRQLIISKGG